MCCKSLFHFYNLKPVFYTWNSTEGDIQKINEAEKIDEIPIKRLSSVISVGDFIIKTCFNPNKIIEIIDENKNILTPTDDYFKKVRDNLENIEYCYSTRIANTYNNSEFVVVVGLLSDYFADYLSDYLAEYFVEYSEDYFVEYLEDY